MRVGAKAWKVIVGLGMAIVLSVCVVLAEQPDKVKAALSSAEAWLSIVDEGKYSDSWKQSAAYFRTAVKQEDAI